jgi:peroxiredoxin
MQQTPIKAPELMVAQWVNSKEDITLSGLLGKVVVVEAFQMLCPGCVSHTIPQAKRIVEVFQDQDVVVLGLHTVFEHYAAQGSVEAISAFIHEYRIPFPVGIDQQTDGIPVTMAAYRMQGTPTQLLIDRQGMLRRQSFGLIDDLTLGAEIMKLLITDG